MTKEGEPCLLLLYRKLHCNICVCCYLFRSWLEGRKRRYPFDDDEPRQESIQRHSVENYGNKWVFSWCDANSEKDISGIPTSIDYHHGLSVDEPPQQPVCYNNNNNNNNNIIIIIIKIKKIIIITKTMFMTQSHCVSLPGSHCECRTASDGCRPGPSEWT